MTASIIIEDRTIRRARTLGELVLDMPARYGRTWDRAVSRELLTAQIAGIVEALIDAIEREPGLRDRRSVWAIAMRLAGKVAA